MFYPTRFNFVLRDDLSYNCVSAHYKHACSLCMYVNPNMFGLCAYSIKRWKIYGHI